MKEMTYFSHLKELRKRILFVFILFILSVILGLAIAGPVIRWLKPDLDWKAFALPDALGVYMKIASLIGLIITFPVILYQIWAFVRPGLRNNEQKVALRFIPIATFLFLIGLSFAYFILFPMIIEFMVKITKLSGAELVLGMNQYFSFLFSIIIPIALLFEMPILVMFLTRIRIINPNRLKKARKFAYLLLVIIATIITPPELVTEILVSIPLILLYELSVWVSKIVYRKQLMEDERHAREFNQ